MKMKFNIPKIDSLKEKVNTVKNKIKKTKEDKVKIQPRYYGLLFLMILLGVVTVATNIKTYNDITSERYLEYELPIDIQVNANEENIDKINYETAISSISTNVSNIKAETKEQSQNDVQKTKVKYIWPVEGEVLREYAKDSLIYSKTMEMWLIHTGIDIKTVLGESVKCIADGTVVAIERDSFYGNVVKVQHANNYISVYANLADVDLPSVNAKLKQGDVVGRVGETAYGECEEEMHLHFEITKDGASINPEEFLNNKE